jgi:hypothetical protein
MRNQNNGERTSIEEIHPHTLGSRPYGWYPNGRAHAGRAASSAWARWNCATAELLDARQRPWTLLKNTRQHGSVRVRLQEQFDATTGQRAQDVSPRLL